MWQKGCTIFLVTAVCSNHLFELIVEILNFSSFPYDLIICRSPIWHSVKNIKLDNERFNKKPSFYTATKGALKILKPRVHRCYLPEGITNNHHGSLAGMERTYLCSEKTERL